MVFIINTDLYILIILLSVCQQISITLLVETLITINTEPQSCSIPLPPIPPVTTLFFSLPLSSHFVPLGYITALLIVTSFDADSPQTYLKPRHVSKDTGVSRKTQLTRELEQKHQRLRKFTFKYTSELLSVICSVKCFLLFVSVNKKLCENISTLTAL